jgi:hypothetical protein
MTEWPLSPGGASRSAIRPELANGAPKWWSTTWEVQGTVQVKALPALRKGRGRTVLGGEVAGVKIPWPRPKVVKPVNKAIEVSVGWTFSS